MISDNRVSNIRSNGNPTYYEDGGWCNCADGIYVDGGTRISVRGNVVTSNDIGIEVAAENARGSADNVDVRSTMITGSLYVGITTGSYRDGASDCGDVTTGRSHAYENRLANNTVTATNDAGAVLGTVDRADADKVSGHNTSDHNTFAVSGTPEVSFGWLGRTYSSFAAYHKATGQDRHSTFTG